MSYRLLDQINLMLDAIVRNEEHPDIVQVSGGEPTLHPEFFAILDAAKRRPISTPTDCESLQKKTSSRA